MGHVLFLWHTHHGTSPEGGSDTNQCAELADGSNGSTYGDYVADTPADPHLRFNVNPTTCTWNGSGRDARGNSYNPDERNIMSYTDVNCMTYFTTEQGQRMRNAIQNLSFLQQVIYTPPPTLSSLDDLCPNTTEIITLANLPRGATTTWTASSNVRIVSRSNSRATIRPATTSSSGRAWVQATLSNGQLLTRNFTIQSLEFSAFPQFANGLGGDEDESQCQNTESESEGFLCTSHYGNRFIIPNSSRSSTRERIRYRISDLSGNILYTSQVVHGSGDDINYIPRPPGRYLFQLRKMNGCGTSQWISTEVNYRDCGEFECNNREFDFLLSRWR